MVREGAGTSMQGIGLTRCACAAGVEHEHIVFAWGPARSSRACMNVHVGVNL